MIQYTQQTITTTMREIFKYKKGKDFYRDSLEYLEYDPDHPPVKKNKRPEKSAMTDDDEISYYIFHIKNKKH